MIGEVLGRCLTSRRVVHCILRLTLEYTGNTSESNHLPPMKIADLDHWIYPSEEASRN